MLSLKVYQFLDKAFQLIRKHIPLSSVKRRFKGTCLAGYAHEFYIGITQNPRWLLMRYIGRLDTASHLMVALTKKTRDRQIRARTAATPPSMFPNLDVEHIVAALSREGVYVGLALPEEIRAEILDFAHRVDCYVNRRPDAGFRYIAKDEAERAYGEPILLGFYTETCARCPAIRKVGEDPGLREIARRFLGAEPVHQGTQLWWSFATRSTDDRASNQNFHDDLDDYRFLKFFFYLTDTDTSAGPHVCVRGTHRKKKLSHKLLRGTFNDRTILDSYGAENVFTICGAAGFGFIEDTRCFHKGKPPVLRDRLMLQLEFALHDYGQVHDRMDPSSQKRIQALQHGSCDQT